ncbi:hypothetical protein OH76DRAFT_1306621, partial [Lentinus brumalis]
MLRMSRAVVAGLGALHILFPAYPCPPFLEIFTPIHEYDEVLNFLRYCEHLTPARPPTMPGNRGVRRVAYLTKGSSAVFVIEASVDFATYSLPSEWNSTLANYIGVYEYQSAYPDLTAAGRALV